MRERAVTLELYTKPPQKRGERLATFLDMFESIWLQRHLKPFEAGAVYLEFDWTFYSGRTGSRAHLVWAAIARELWKRRVVIGPGAWFECAGARYHHDVPRGAMPHVTFTLKGEV